MSKARDLADLLSRPSAPGGGGAPVDPSVQPDDLLKWDGQQLIASGVTSDAAGNLSVNDLITAPDSVRLGASQTLKAAGANMGVLKEATGEFFHPVWQKFNQNAVYRVEWRDSIDVLAPPHTQTVVNPTLTTTVPDIPNAVGADVRAITITYTQVPPRDTRFEIKELINGEWKVVWGHTEEDVAQTGAHKVLFDVPYRAYEGQQFQICVTSKTSDIHLAATEDGGLAADLHITPFTLVALGAQDDVTAIEGRVQALEAHQSTLTDDERAAILSASRRLDQTLAATGVNASNAATAEQGAVSAYQSVEQTKSAIEQIQTNTLRAVDALAAAGRAPGHLVMLQGYEFIATQGQTTFSGADANAHALRYTPTNGLRVHVNGFMLRPLDDYRAMDGTSIVLQTPLQAGDWVSVVPLAQPDDLVSPQSITDIPGLSTALDEKFSPANTPSISQVQGLSAALSAKFDGTNKPNIMDVNGLATALNGKFSRRNKPTLQDVDGLAAALEALVSQGHIGNGRKVSAATWVFDTSSRINITKAGWFQITIIGAGGGGAGGYLVNQAAKTGGGCGGGGGGVLSLHKYLDVGSYSCWVGSGGRGGSGKAAGVAATGGQDGGRTAFQIGATRYEAEGGQGATAGIAGLPGMGASTAGARPGGWGGYGDHFCSGGGGASGGSDAHNKVEVEISGFAQRMLGGDGFGGGGIGATRTPAEAVKQPNGGNGVDATRSFSSIVFGNFGGGGGGGAPTDREDVAAGDGGDGAAGAVILEAIPGGAND